MAFSTTLARAPPFAGTCTWYPVKLNQQNLNNDRPNEGSSVSGHDAIATVVFSAERGARTGMQRIFTPHEL